MDKRVYERSRGPAEAAPISGGNAGDMRYGKRFGTDGWDTNPVPRSERKANERRGQVPYAGSHHARRFGVRPWAGGGDEASGFATPSMILDGASKRARTKREDRLVASARAVAATRGKVRAELLTLARLECDSLDGLSERASGIAGDVREALGL